MDRAVEAAYAKFKQDVYCSPDVLPNFPLAIAAAYEADAEYLNLGLVAGSHVVGTQERTAIINWLRARAAELRGGG